MKTTSKAVSFKSVILTSLKYMATIALFGFMVIGAITMFIYA